MSRRRSRAWAARGRSAPGPTPNAGTGAVASPSCLAAPRLPRIGPTCGRGLRRGPDRSAPPATTGMAASPSTTSPRDEGDAGSGDFFTRPRRFSGAAAIACGGCPPLWSAGRVMKCPGRAPSARPGRFPHAVKSQTPFGGEARSGRARASSAARASTWISSRESPTQRRCGRSERLPARGGFIPRADTAKPGPHRLSAARPRSYRAGSPHCASCRTRRLHPCSCRTRKLRPVVAHPRPAERASCR